MRRQAWLEVTDKMPSARRRPLTDLAISERETARSDRPGDFSAAGEVDCACSRVAKSTQRQPYLCTSSANAFGTRRLMICNGWISDGPLKATWSRADSWLLAWIDQLVLVRAS